MAEDEKTIRRELTILLENAMYQVTAPENFENIPDQITEVSPDLILLDVNLPGMSGFDICTMLRQRENTCPVIFLTSRTDSMDELNGMLRGGDDYITKPFGMMELVSRVKAVLRRSNRNEKKDEIVIGQLKIYPNKHKVKSCGNEVTLTNKEFKLLCLLVESKGNVLNRDQLLTNIWGYDFDGETRTVDVHIRSLRQKLGECGKLIETVRGIGYRIGGNES